MDGKIPYKSAVVISTLFLLLTQTYAASPGTTIFPFLKISPSARDSAMGEISSLSASGSPESNPAVLPWQEQNEISLNYMAYFQDTNYSYLNYLGHMKDSMAYNVSLGYLGVGGLTRTVADSSTQGFSETGSFNFSDMLANLGFGQKVSEYFSYGVSAKYVQESIDSNANSGYMLSLGGYFSNLPNSWRIGFGVFNLGPQVKGYNLPSGVYGGVAKQLTPAILAEAEVVGYLDTVTEAKVGFEFVPAKAIILRAGYNYPLSDNDLGNFPVNITAGLGLNLGNFSLDYAWVPYGDLGQTHRLSLTKKFGARHIIENPNEEITPVINRNEKELIAVFDLTCDNLPAALTKMTSNILRLELANTNTYTVLDQTVVEQAVSNHKDQLSGLEEQAADVKVGKFLNAKYIVTGSMKDINGTYYISVNQIDVESGKVARTTSEKAESAKDIRHAAAEIAWKLSE